MKCRKVWRLLAPEHTHLLYDRFGRELAPDFTLNDPGAEERFPNLRLADQLAMTVVQVGGELS
jgi:hypothetical protein